MAGESGKLRPSAVPQDIEAAGDQLDAVGVQASEVFHLDPDCRFGRSCGAGA